MTDMRGKWSPWANDRERFFAKTERQPDGCLYWIAGVRDKRHGYGGFQIGGRFEGAHRVAWWLANGEWPDGFVCHKCDTPRCVEITHLFVGTQADNMRDCVRKGRFKSNVGSHNPHALSPEVVRAVHGLRGSGLSTRMVAEQTGVSKSTVSRIWRDAHWAVRSDLAGTAYL